MGAIFDWVRVRNYRSIRDSGQLDLGPITLLVGRNNSGKSALLRAIYLIQMGSRLSNDDFRIGADDLDVQLGLRDVSHLRLATGETLTDGFIGGHLSYTAKRMLPDGFSMQIKAVNVDGGEAEFNAIPQQEPQSLIFPVLTGRRPGSYQSQVREDSSRTVLPTDDNLVGRVMELASDNVPEAAKFRDLSRRVLGVNFDVINGANGQLIGVKIDRYQRILLESMGSGLSGTLSLLVNLSVADGNVVLVEEPENDLHPAALKVLLSAIRESSDRNQFVISTHSSVVLTMLGSLPNTRVLHTVSDRALPPTSEYRKVGGTEERMHILRDLGYELADLGLGDGWLIFEESSAERIVRDFLIPMFAPALARLRTLAAMGISRVSPIMQDFREMLLFAHLDGPYRGRAWVLVDGDEVGRKTVEDLRRSFKGGMPRISRRGTNRFSSAIIQSYLTSGLMRSSILKTNKIGGLRRRPC
ncbi:ATP-dependent nuclease [Dactylosporangium sp. NPDC051541]|uniref:ATP-dependent nuclease n=1 Tax=Dactylosporangium sp. NPDC051541 TaxID=3363977 RepID=UPI0037B2AC24